MKEQIYQFYIIPSNSTIHRDLTVNELSFKTVMQAGVEKCVVIDKNPKDVSTEMVVRDICRKFGYRHYLKVPLDRQTWVIQVDRPQTPSKVGTFKNVPMADQLTFNDQGVFYAIK